MKEIKGLAKIYGRRENKEMKTYSHEENLYKEDKQIHEQVIDLQDEPWEYGEEIRKDKESMECMKEIYNIFNDLLNDLSIIIHRAEEGLFPGDVSEKILANALSQLKNQNDTDKAKEYILILTPHHGSVWPKSIIKSKVVINSCGDYKNYKGPTYLLKEMQAQSETPIRVYCTDGHGRCLIKPRDLPCLTPNKTLTFAILYTGKLNYCELSYNSKPCIYF